MRYARRCDRSHTTPVRAFRVTSFARGLYPSEAIMHPPQTPYPAAPYGQPPPNPVFAPQVQHNPGFAPQVQPNPAFAPQVQPLHGVVPGATPVAVQPGDVMPGCPHTYAIAERKTGFFVALRLSLKLLPYALFRFAHWSMFTAISIAMVVAALGLGTFLSIAVNKWVGVVLIFGGLIPFAWFWLPFVERKTFGAKCAHIAMLTELITKGQIGDGRQGLFDYAKHVVTTRLGDLCSLWDVHRSVNRTLRQLGRVLDVIGTWMPIDISAVKRVLYAVVSGVSRYLDAVILSYGWARGDQDFADPAIDGVVYCAQNGRKMFTTGIGVVVLEWLMVVPLWLMAALGSISSVFAATYAAQGGDLAALRVDLVGTIKAAPVPVLIAVGAGLVVGGLIAWLIVRTIRESLIQPTLITMVMLKFHNAVERQPLEESWKERLRGAGDGLGQLDDLRRRSQLA